MKPLLLVFACISLVEPALGAEPSASLDDLLAARKRLRALAATVPGPVARGDADTQRLKDQEEAICRAIEPLLLARFRVDFAGRNPKNTYPQVAWPRSMDRQCVEGVMYHFPPRYRVLVTDEKLVREAGAKSSSSAPDLRSIAGKSTNLSCDGAAHTPVMAIETHRANAVASLESVTNGFGYLPNMLAVVLSRGTRFFVVFRDVEGWLKPPSACATPVMDRPEPEAWGLAVSQYHECYRQKLQSDPQMRALEQAVIEAIAIVP
jgi:hypothetical protein